MDIVKNIYLFIEHLKSESKHALSLGNVVRRNFGYIFFLVGLSCIYIANAHHAEKRIRQIKQADEELKKAKWRYGTLRAISLEKGSMASVREKVKEKGLKDINKRPEKIVAYNYED